MLLCSTEHSSTATERTECNRASQMQLLVLQNQLFKLILLHKFRCFLMYRGQIYSTYDVAGVWAEKVGMK
jgi:hypothetical protein